MAFVKRDFRRLLAGKRMFFWRYACQDPVIRMALAHSRRALATEPHEDRVLVRPEDAPHRLLRVYCGVGCPLVTPGVVRRWIDTAASLGWPSERVSLELDGLDESGRPGVGRLAAPRVSEASRNG